MYKSPSEPRRLPPSPDPPMTTPIQLGTPLQVYKNLTTGTWSAKARVPHPKTGKLVWRKIWGGDSITLARCTPKTSEKGAARIRSKNSREVVAWITGEFVSFSGDHSEGLFKSVHYNPFRRDDFHGLDGATYTGSTLAVFPANSSHFLSR